MGSMFITIIRNKFNYCLTHTSTVTHFIFQKVDKLENHVSKGRTGIESNESTVNKGNGYVTKCANSFS